MSMSVSVCMCVCVFRIVMLEPLLMSTLSVSFSVCLFVKLLVTFSMSMCIMCVIILVQRFEPQGRRLTNLHYCLII